MKSIAILIFILTFGASALANTENHAKDNVIEMGVVFDNGADSSSPRSQIEVGTEHGVARLYKFKNSRVKKALAFTTKHSQSKLV